MVDIKLKNANKRVQEVHLNGQRQRRSYDFTLTNNGISFKPNLAKGNRSLVTVILEEHFVVD